MVWCSVITVQVDVLFANSKLIASDSHFSTDVAIAIKNMCRETIALIGLSSCLWHYIGATTVHLVDLFTAFFLLLMIIFLAEGVSSV